MSVCTCVILADLFFWANTTALQEEVEVFVDGLNVGHFGLKTFQLPRVLYTADLLKVLVYLCNW